MFYIDVFLLAVSVLSSIVLSSKRKKYRKTVLKYPEDTMFWVTDFFVKGCENFITGCPRVYKYQLICAKNYNDDYKNFDNYCQMQYENCNTWRKWRVFKREKC